MRASEAKQTMHAHICMAVDGLGFYLSHFSKPLSKKPKRSFNGLVKVIEGLVSVKDLEKILVLIFRGESLGKLPSVTLDFLCSSPLKRDWMRC